MSFPNYPNAQNPNDGGPWPSQPLYGQQGFQQPQSYPQQQQQPPQQQPQQPQWNSPANPNQQWVQNPQPAQPSSSVAMPPWQVLASGAIFLVTFIFSFLPSLSLRISGSGIAGAFTDSMEEELGDLGELGELFGSSGLDDLSGAMDGLGSAYLSINWWGSIKAGGDGAGQALGLFEDAIRDEAYAQAEGLQFAFVFATLIVLGLFLASVISAFTKRITMSAIFGLIAAGVQFLLLLGAAITSVTLNGAMQGIAGARLGAGFWMWLLVFIASMVVFIRMVMKKNSGVTPAPTPMPTPTTYPSQSPYAAPTYPQQIQHQPQPPQTGWNSNSSQGTQSNQNSTAPSPEPGSAQGWGEQSPRSGSYGWGQ